MKTAMKPAKLTLENIFDNEDSNDSSELNTKTKIKKEKSNSSGATKAKTTKKNSARKRQSKDVDLLSNSSPRGSLKSRMFGGTLGLSRRIGSLSPMAKTSSGFFGSDKIKSSENEKLYETKSSIKANMRAQIWSTYSKKKSYTLLDDVTGNLPRLAKHNKPVSYSLCLHRVKNWPISPVLHERVCSNKSILKLTLYISFYHAGSKRFYGNTSQGSLIQCEMGKQVNGTKNLNTTHMDLVYWYTNYEDPNCLIVIELVAIEVHRKNGIEIDRYGCGWTFLQMHGPLDSISENHCNFYDGTPRNLLLFQPTDFQKLNEHEIAGCTLSYELQIFPKFFIVHHLLRENEFIGATESLPGIQERRLKVLAGYCDETINKKKSLIEESNKEVIGPFIGFELEETTGRKSGVLRNILPRKPSLCPTNVIVLENIKIVFDDRLEFENILLYTLKDETPDSEVVHAVTANKILGRFSNSKQEVVRFNKSGITRAKIVDRKIKLGFHNGHTLISNESNTWSEANLIENDENENELILAENTSSLYAEGYVKHPLVSLLLLIEYTVRMKSKDFNTSNFKSSTQLGLDKESLLQTTLAQKSFTMPVLICMQSFVPFDGKRLHLRNIPLSNTLGGFTIPLKVDNHVKFVTSSSIFNPKDDEFFSDENGREKNYLYFNLKCHDSNGNLIEDETPLDEEESLLDVASLHITDFDTDSSSAITNSSKDDDLKNESSREPTTIESVNKVEKTSTLRPKYSIKEKMSIKKRHKWVKKLPKHAVSLKQKKAVIKESSSSLSSLSSSSLSSSSLSSSSLSSSLPPKKNKSTSKKKMISNQISSDSDSKILPQEKSSKKVGKVVLTDYSSAAVIIRPGSRNQCGHDLSRASMTRLSQFGYSDIFEDSTKRESKSIDFKKELSDPLKCNDVFFQFIGFRTPQSGMSIPSSLQFSYQFYTCKPTNTEKIILLDASNKEDTTANILVKRESNGCNVPTTIIKHCVDLSYMQNFEANDFLRYMSSKSLFIDVWDGEGLMLIGTITVPLQTILRQGTKVFKRAAEYEVITPCGLCGDDSAAYAGVVISPNAIQDGRVVGIVQILISNYGEIGSGQSKNLTVTSQPSINLSKDIMQWRTRAREAALGTKVNHGPRHRIRAKPLSESNPELMRYLKEADKYAVISNHCASYKNDACNDDCIGYDELMLLVRRFRAPERGRVIYGGRLMSLLDVPSIPKLESLLIAGITKFEQKGGYLVNVLDKYSSRNLNNTQLYLTLDNLQYALQEMQAFSDIQPEYSAFILSRLFRISHREKNDSISIQQFILWVRCRQTHSLIDRKPDVMKSLMGTLKSKKMDVQRAIQSLDEDSNEYINTDKVVHVLTNLLSIDKMSNNSTLMFAIKNLLGTKERISIEDLNQLLGIEYVIPTNFESKVRKAILKAEHETNLSIEDQFVRMELIKKDQISKSDFIRGLEITAVTKILENKYISVLCDRFECQNGSISFKNFLEFVGRGWQADDNITLSKLKIALKQIQKSGKSFYHAFKTLDDDENSFTTPDILLSLLESLGVFGILSKKEVRKMLCNLLESNGVIHIEDFLNFVDQPVFTGKKVLIRLKETLLALEAQGTSILDIFSVFDKEESGYISKVDLLEIFETLGISSNLSSLEVENLIQHFTDNENSSVSMESILGFIGLEYSPLAKAEKKLAKILNQLETDGISLELAFSAMDRQNKGFIAVDDMKNIMENLGLLSSISRKKMDQLLNRFDLNGDGQISLRDFLAFAGKPYTVCDSPLEAKLRRIIAKTQLMGIPLQSTFLHFDQKGCGEISSSEFEKGLREIGAFDEFSSEEVNEVIKKFNCGRDSGSIDLPRFMIFLGQSFFVDDEAKLRQILLKTESIGTTLEQIFDLFDSKHVGKLYCEELLTGLRQLGQFYHFNRNKAEIFISKYGRNGFLSKKDFVSFARNETITKVQNEEKKKIDAENECRAAQNLLQEYSSKLKANDVVLVFNSFDWRENGTLDLKQVKMALHCLGIKSNMISLHMLRSILEHLKSISIPGAISIPSLLECMNLRLEPDMQFTKESEEECKSGCLKYNAAQLMYEVASRYDKKVSSMEHVFAAYITDYSGLISVRGFYKGLEQMISFSSNAISRTTLDEAIEVLDTKSDGMIDLIEFIRNVRNLPSYNGAPENDIPLEINYEFSTDPDTRDIEKKVRRMAAKKIQRGIDVEHIFRKHDTDCSGTIFRADFVQAIMELGLNLVESHSMNFNSKVSADIRERQIAQLSKNKDSNERKRILMRQMNITDFGKEQGETKEEDIYEPNELASETLVLMNWYREGKKKELVQSLLTNSLTTVYQIRFSFGQPLFWEHSIENPYNHEERFFIEFDNLRLRLVTSSKEWYLLRTTVEPCVGQLGKSSVESDLFDVDNSGKIQIMLMANEVVHIPFVFLDLNPIIDDIHCEKTSEESTTVRFVSSASGHIINTMKLDFFRTPFPVHRTFTFYQPEGEVLNRSIRLLADSKKDDLNIKQAHMSGLQDPKRKVIQLVDRSGGKVVVESRQPSDSLDLHIFIKYRIGAFPSVGEFHILVYDDFMKSALYEIWHVKVYARLRLDVHATLGQTTSTTLVIRGDQYARRVKSFSSLPVDCEFELQTEFQLVPGAYNTIALKMRPKSIGTKKMLINIVDIDSQELVGGWVATVTSVQPVVNKSYELDLPVGQIIYKRIAYTNPWKSSRCFKLCSSNDNIMAPRNVNFEVEAGGVGFIRLLLHTPHVPVKEDVFLFINDENGKNEECLLFQFNCS